jgi:putative cell wall-binding protein
VGAVRFAKSPPRPPALSAASPNAPPSNAAPTAPGAGRHAGKSLAMLLAVALLIAAALLAAGCGKSASTGGAGGSMTAGGSPGPLGSTLVATKNTTRLGGASAREDAAAVALAVYPGLTPATRPQAVVLVDERDWPAALVASTLAGRPLHAPLLYTSARGIPAASAAALAAMRPTGAGGVEGAQAIAIGDASVPAGYVGRAVRAGDPATLAVAVEQLASSLRGRAPSSVIVTALDAPPAMTMPAAALAAQSGAPILLVRGTQLPAATAGELRRLGTPTIYLVGPTSVVSTPVAQELQHFGTVKRIDGGITPAANAVAVARYSDGSFGWGAVEPGHGLVFANAQRPLDGPAAAPLAATGDYAPLLVLESAHALPGALATYLSDLQPGTPPSGAVHGVYNHGWLIGDESAISATTQARIDAILEIAPREASEAEPGA